MDSSYECSLGCMYMSEQRKGGRTVQVLVVEDNPADTYLIVSALRDARIPNEIHTASDGEEALKFLLRQGEHANASRPDFVFLDLNLPKIDGHEVLAAMKADRQLRRIPVIVVSGSSLESDLVRAYDQQVAGYLVKPLRHDEYFAAIRAVKELWLHVVTLPPKSESAAI